MGTLPSPSKPSFFQRFELASTAPYFKNINLRFFAILLDNNIIVAIIGVDRGEGQGVRPPPFEMLPMIKMSQKRLLFIQFQFLLASSSTTVHAYNSN